MKTESDKKNIFLLTKKDIFFLFIGFFVLFTITITAYNNITPLGLSSNGQIMIGILLMAAIFWITEPIPLPVTGLLIMIAQPILGIMKPESVFSNFGNQAVFFLIGAFIIAAAVEKHGLHKRIALKFLSRFDQNPRLFTLGIMLSCAFLSFVMPEHGVAALFLPIVISVLVAMKVVPRKSNFGKISLLSIAYGCSIGSLGTLIGGARNPLAIGFLSSLKDPIIVSFAEWMMYSMPIVLISLPLVWLILNFSFPIEVKNIKNAKKEIQKQVKESGKISKKEITVLSIMILTILLWIFFSHHEYFGLAVIAIFGSFLMFISGVINWKDVEKRIPWGIILMYGGAITLGMGISKTGAGIWIANQIFNTAGVNIPLVILFMIVITVLLTNIMSNVGAVAILLPIGVSIATKIGVSPLLTTLIIALSGGLAFMFVIATPGNAITYSAGYYSTKDLLRGGILANITCIGIVFIVAIVYWMGVLNIG